MDFNDLCAIEPALIGIWDMPVGSDLQIVRDEQGIHIFDTPTGRGQSFTMDFDVNQKLIDYFEPNISIADGAKITGSFDGNTDNLKLNLNAPCCTISKR